MQNALGPACIFLRKGIAEKHGVRCLVLPGERELGTRTPGFSPQLWEGSGGWWVRAGGLEARTSGFSPAPTPVPELGRESRRPGAQRPGSQPLALTPLPGLGANPGVLTPAPSQFDANGDGEITLDELQLAMQRLMGERLTPREISDVVKEADINGDGTVDFEGAWGALGDCG
uniref:EF-hand domain-containing protein n=1 Tax=Gopherus evgoodei TaxID=1825980 RepID=A0A8C4Y5X6_9SAUR